MKKCKWIIMLLCLFCISQVFAAICGDVNGDGEADIVDALLIAQFYVGMDPQPFNQSVADADGNGMINIVDSLTVAQFYVGIISSLAGCPAIKTPEPTTPPKTRVIATTDGEVDDQCSLVRFLLYANDWDIEGIITSSSQYHWQGRYWAGDNWQKPYLDAYKKVYPNLKIHDPDYPTPDYIYQQSHLGNVRREGDMSKATEGSNHIVKALLKADDRPIWLQAWGGMNTIARALKTIEEDYPDRMEEVAKKIRFFFIWEQDNTYQSYIKKSWGKYNILTIISDQFLCFAYTWKKWKMPAEPRRYLEKTWMIENLVKNHGPLLDTYKELKDGSFNSEGDSPAFLHAIPNGLRSLELPSFGGWGGRYVNIRDNDWLDEVHIDGYKYPSGRWYTKNAWGRVSFRKKSATTAEFTEYFKPITRWIPDIQNDFAARADWCITSSYEDANHPPVVMLGHPEDLTAQPGDTVELSAQGTSDPDGDQLTYKWWQYTEADSANGTVSIDNANSQTGVSFKVPNESGKQVHIVLEVKDNGTPVLTRYRRVIVDIN